MLVAIIVLFAICWGPTFIDDVLVAYGVVSKLNYGHLKPMRQVILHLTIFVFFSLLIIKVPTLNVPKTIVNLLLYWTNHVWSCFSSFYFKHICRLLR